MVSFNAMGQFSVCVCVNKGAASQCYRYRASESVQAFCVEVQCLFVFVF